MQKNANIVRKSVNTIQFIYRYFSLYLRGRFVDDPQVWKKISEISIFFIFFQFLKFILDSIAHLVHRLYGSTRVHLFENILVKGNILQNYFPFIPKNLSINEFLSTI